MVRSSKWVFAIYCVRNSQRHWKQWNNRTILRSVLVFQNHNMITSFILQMNNLLM
nr:MAG TPA: hypothetical protein [Caudoviricetes sp.]